jgi:hypothetical protein
LVTVSAWKFDSLVQWIARTDRLGRRLARWSGGPPAPPYGEGVSVILAEPAHPQQLSECLESVRAAAADWLEPVEIIVIVSGPARARYDTLRRAHPAVTWRFQASPLEYAEALEAGLRKARSDWVCLLNCGAAVPGNAFSLLAPLREERTFGIGADGALRIENGLVAIPDPVLGTASLFQTRLLRWLLDPAVYHPLSWNQVEWHWRARKLGYRCVTSPLPAAAWQQENTDQPWDTLLQNRLLFQLRNLTTAGSLERVLDEIAQSPETVAQFFSRRATLWQIARGRLWNHRAPLADEDVLAEWAPIAVGAD